ncbi:unnamed protein product [Blepharisma stoltei]|uniref:Autophagy-related protein n=1 Tax=Blepharisma stoltei TaxID=1481888 RepID=A0AAU9IJ00_9CILI|nr:unnamed protein product [Blepharisma stoltei]
MSLDRSEIKKYKESTQFQVRKESYDKIMRENPGKYPCVIIKGNRCKYNIPTHKFALEGSMTVSCFLYTLRRYFKLSPKQGLYLYLCDTLPMLGAKISELHQRCSDEDGCLYFVLTNQEDKGAMSV